MCVAIVAITGCTNTIRVPPADAETDYARAFVVDHGYHTRIAVTDTQGGVAEYAFGEWNWYALNQDALTRIPVVLFWPTDGAYARRVHPPSNGVARFLTENAGLPMIVAPVEAEKASAFRARMDGLFTSADQLVYNARYGLEFVPAERGYSGLSNSNQVAAEWLEELGLEVRGSRLFADWRMDGPSPDAPRGALP